VTVTDLKARKSVGTIGIPGCGLVFAQAPTRFSSLCADGAIATVTFDEAANGTIKRSANVFDAKNDPAFEHSGWDKHHQMLYLVTYHGKVVPVDLAGEQAVAGASWWLSSDAERRAGWRPGGWQVCHFHSSKRRLYVLMHRGHDWTHKISGTEVWEFDATSGRRLQRVRLPEPAQSIAVSQDEDALLYAIGDSNRIYAVRLATAKLAYKTKPLGFSPLLLTVWGE
jgi:methylamine dehydrogenase heavy chain